ncbi:hypothetical protein [Aggregatibacter kilianii]|uniref:hypothetical protein n=1 Tax=Aggregatibacter kilianii TaxID=2025884 RepID=UPI000D64F3A9|nr:hypothetical protein [Aggregatibacter kilianii]
MIKYFKDNPSQSSRAVQAWQILISVAMNRQTCTYKSLSNLMYGHDASGVLGGILGHIAFFCNKNNLPPLTCIVVNGKTGLPGDNIPVSEDLNKLREDVYREDWYAIYPPTENDLKVTNTSKVIK